jgi:peptidoglycan/LPS O-acetylase OafA/YrhL
MGKLRYLDGLRGVAILLVFMIHADGWGLRSLGDIGNSIVVHGKYGVTVFFVASAYMICLSASRAFNGDGYNWKAFYVRRFFRIAPMYFLVLAYVIIMTGGAKWTTTTSIISHFTFLNVLYPRYANDMLSVEWSIAVEMAFYAIFPILVMAVRKNVAAVAVFTALLLAIPFAPHVVYRSIGGDLFEFRHYTLPWHAYAFLCGVLAFHYRDRLQSTKYLIAALLVLALQLVIGEGWWSGRVFAVVTALVIINGHHNGWFARLLSFSPLTFIGEISFSLYLIHIIIIEMYGPYLAVPIAVFLAYLCKTLVEAPFQSWSKTLFTEPLSRAAKMP